MYDPGDALAVLHVLRAVGPESFGVGAIARALIHEQEQVGDHAVSWSTDPEQDWSPESWREGAPSAWAVRFPQRVFRGYSPKMAAAAAGPEGEAFDLAHQHSLWSGASITTLRWRRRWGRPTIIAPHGTLDPWTLHQSRWKKRLARIAYEDANLAEASCLHATGEQEINAFRDCGLNNPIAFVPNGVSDAWLESRGSASRFRDKHGVACDARVMLFLSRVARKKGLPLLLEAMREAREVMRDWLLVVAGPDERGHAAEVERLAGSLGLSSRVRLVGPLYGQDRRDAFEAAELFVLPTHSEGNPMAVLEALGVGKPVLVTTGVPCPFIESAGLGWRTEISADAIAEGLRSAAAESPEALRKRGTLAQEYVGRHCRWSTASAELRRVYDWLLGRADRPDCVFT